MQLFTLLSISHSKLNPEPFLKIIPVRLHCGLTPASSKNSWSDTPAGTPTPGPFGERDRPLLTSLCSDPGLQELSLPESVSVLQEGTHTEPPALTQSCRSTHTPWGPKGHRRARRWQAELGDAASQPFWDSTAGHKDSWLPPELREGDPQYYKITLIFIYNFLWKTSIGLWLYKWPTVFLQMTHMYKYVPMTYVILYLPYILYNSILWRVGFFFLKIKHAMNSEVLSDIQTELSLYIFLLSLQIQRACKHFIVEVRFFNQYSHWIIHCWGIKSIQNIFNLLEGKSVNCLFVCL